MASQKVHRGGVAVIYNAAHGEERIRRAGFGVAYWEAEPKLAVQRGGAVVAYWEEPLPPPVPRSPRVISASAPRRNRTGQGARIVSAGIPTSSRMPD